MGDHSKRLRHIFNKYAIKIEFNSMQGFDWCPWMGHLNVYEYLKTNIKLHELFSDKILIDNYGNKSDMTHKLKKRQDRVKVSYDSI